MKGSCCLRGGLAGRARGEADGPPVIPGAELPQPESGVARRVPDGGSGDGGDGNSSQDGGEAADPDGQREAQQKHHAAWQRGQDLGRGPVAALSGRLLAPFSRRSRRAGTPVPFSQGERGAGAAEASLFKAPSVLRRLPPVWLGGFLPFGFPLLRRPSSVRPSLPPSPAW